MNLRSLGVKVTVKKWLNGKKILSVQSRFVDTSSFILTKKNKKRAIKDLNKLAKAIRNS